MKLRAYPKVVSLLTLFLLLIGAANVFAQGRMSDKDVENTMKSLKDDARKFRSAFNSSVGKSISKPRPC